MNNQTEHYGIFQTYKLKYNLELDIIYSEIVYWELNSYRL